MVVTMAMENGQISCVHTLPHKMLLVFVKMIYTSSGLTQRAGDWLRTVRTIRQKKAAEKYATRINVKASGAITTIKIRHLLHEVGDEDSRNSWIACSHLTICVDS